MDLLYEETFEIFRAPGDERMHTFLLLFYREFRRRGEKESEREREREEEVGTSNRDEIYSFPPWQDLISFAVGLALDLAGL